jgi:hypothetical protein
MIGYRKLSRRAILGGAGATLALPFLESAIPRALRTRAAAQAAAPLRFLGYYVPCGMRMQHWTPMTEGAGYDLPRILVPLADLQSDVSVISRLANRPARPDGPGDHASGTGAFMTAMHPRKTGGADIENGISLDQHLAAELGGDTTLRSLEIGIDGGPSAGDCDSGYSCAYATNVAWTGPATPLPKLTDPGIIFDRLFAGFDAGESAEQIESRLRRNSSVLDYVLGDASSLGMKLGVRDREKLDEYMTGVRELELRLESSSQGPTCEPGMRPPGDLTFPDKVRAMSDLMVLAFQCDVTRFMTFMLGNAASNRSYDFLGVTGGHHEISHHAGDANKLESLSVIDTWEIEQLAYLLDRMRQIDEGGTSMLHNSVVFFSSEIEDGDSHSHFNMPILLAGAAGGAFTPGRHLVYPDEPSVGSLFLSIAQAFGMGTSSFGDAADPLDGLS